MAKAGPRADRGRLRRRAQSAEVRAALVAAAIEALRETGFAGASAREIAGRAGYSQALVFYHFGSVNDLLLAALDEVSARRMDAYRGLLEHASSMTALAESARSIFVEDLDAGYVRVLVEMITGAQAVPGLGDQVAERLRPGVTSPRKPCGTRSAGPPRRSCCRRPRRRTRWWPFSSVWSCWPASTATAAPRSRCSTGFARWPGCSTCSAGCDCPPGGKDDR